MTVAGPRSRAWSRRCTSSPALASPVRESWELRSLARHAITCGHRDRQDERRMDESPPHRVLECISVVEHRLRYEDACRGVVHRDERDGEQEDDPVLVQGDHCDDQEEVEVSLDQSTREVHAIGRREQEPERGEDAPRRPLEGSPRCQKRQHRHRKDVDYGMDQVAALGDHCKRAECRNMCPQQHQDAPMSSHQDLARQRVPVREPGSSQRESVRHLRYIGGQWLDLSALSRRGRRRAGFRLGFTSQGGTTTAAQVGRGRDRRDFLRPERNTLNFACVVFGETTYEGEETWTPRA